MARRLNQRPRSARRHDGPHQLDYRPPDEDQEEELSEEEAADKEVVRETLGLLMSFVVFIPIALLVWYLFWLLGFR